MAQEKPWVEFVKSAAKDFVIGLGIGLGVYVLWVVAHSILFGLGG